MDRMSRTVKEESSVPVQSRVSFMSLAKLHAYWVREGYSIRTMSQLVGWSIDLLCEVLEANEKMPMQIKTLAEAHSYLQCHDLYQKSMRERALKKIGTALRFESMRSVGEDPKNVVPVQHSMMHGRTAVVPDNVVSTGSMSDEEWERIQKRIREEDEKDRAAQVKNAVEVAKTSGLVVSESKDEEPEKLSQEEVRARYFKKQAELKGIKRKVIEESKHSNLLSSAKVKEGMSDEEYEEKMKEIAKRDQERMELENAPFEVSELPVVKEVEDNDE